MLPRCKKDLSRKISARCGQGGRGLIDPCVFGDRCVPLIVRISQVARNRSALTERICVMLPTIRPSCSATRVDTFIRLPEQFPVPRISNRVFPVYKKERDFALDSPERQRFTICHELAHIVHHHDIAPLDKFLYRQERGGRLVRLQVNQAGYVLALAGGAGVGMP